jgi:hypothetical protein
VGRALVVFAPTSQRRGSVLPRSPKDTARKALRAGDQGTRCPARTRSCSALEREARLPQARRRARRRRPRRARPRDRATAAAEDQGRDEPAGEVDEDLDAEREDLDGEQPS